MRWLCVVGLLGACGGGDAGDDVQPSPQLGVTDVDGTTVESLTLAQTLVGQDSSGQLRVSNTGSAATGPLAISISGVAANDFLLDNAQTTCAARSLAPGEACDLVVSFRPTAAGERDANLVVASNPGGEMTVALKGIGVMPNLHFNPTSLSFGQIEIGQSAQTTIELRNDGSITVPINSINVSGAAFTKGLSTCGSSLAANTSCDIALTASPQALGALTGSVSVASGNDVFSAPLAVNGARRITVSSEGNGSGTITSSPTGIDCGATCNALFEGAVTLTAEPGANSQITSWSVAGCGQADTCVIPADTSPITVTVSFALTGSASVNITFLGNGTGEVRAKKNDTEIIATCFASCAVPVDAGDQLSFTAATVSSFGGFSGGCTSASGVCSFTVQPGTTNVGVTFQKDTKEQWTRLIPGGTVHAADFDGSGNLIVASSKLTKLGPTGSTVWTRDLAAGGIDTGPNDTIYLTTADTLKKLDANGAELWSRAATGGLGEQCHGVAVGSDGSVAVRDGNSVSRWDSDGNPAWTKTFANSGGRCSVAIDASGNVLVDVESSSVEPTDALRFSSDGTALSTLLNVTNQYRAMLSSDPTGAIVACSTGHSNAHLNAGSPSIAIVSAGAAPNFCSHAGTDIGWVFWNDETNAPAHWFAHRVTSGTSTWSITRTVLSDGFSDHGTAPFAVAGSASGRIAVGGLYSGITVNSGWVQVFDP